MSLGHCFALTAAASSLALGRGSFAGGGAWVPAAAAGFEGAALADAAVEPVDLEKEKKSRGSRWCEYSGCACVEPELASPQISVYVCPVIMHTRNVHTRALNLKIV